MHCSSRSTPIILAIFGFTLVSMAIMIRNLDQITADEFAAVIQLNKELKMDGCLLIHRFLGHDVYDPQWIDRDGRNCTAMCELSSNGGFSSSEWTQKGWILDDASMELLREEFPEEFRKRDRRKAKKLKTAAADSRS